MKKRVTTGSTVFFDVDGLPEETKSELMAIFDNVKAIHGIGYVQHVRFILNLQGLLAGVTCNTTVKEGVDRPALEEVIQTICTNLTMSHAEGYELSDNQISEAFKTADILNSLIKRTNPKTGKIG